MIQRIKISLKFFSPAFSTPCLSSGPVNRSDAWHITVALPAQQRCAQTISANVLKLQPAINTCFASRHLSTDQEQWIEKKLFAE